MKKSLKTLASLLVIFILGVACSKNDPSGNLSDAASINNGPVATADVRTAPEFAVSENDTVEVNGDSVTVFNEKGEVILKGKLADMAAARTSISDVLADNYAVEVEECYAGPASELVGKLIKLPKFPFLNLASTFFMAVEGDTITIKETASSTSDLLKATLLKEKPGKILASVLSVNSAFFPKINAGMKVFMQKINEIYGTPEDLTEVESDGTITLTLPNGVLVKGKKVFSSIYGTYKTLKISEVIGDNAELNEKIGQYLKIKVGEVAEDRCGIAGFIPQKIKDLIASNTQSFFQNENTPTINTEIAAQGFKLIKEQLPSSTPAITRPMIDYIVTPSLLSKCSGTTETSENTSDETTDNSSTDSEASTGNNDTSSQETNCSQVEQNESGAIFGAITSITCEEKASMNTQLLQYLMQNGAYPSSFESIQQLLGSQNQ